MYSKLVCACMCMHARAQAAQNGHQPVVGMLLECGTDRDRSPENTKKYISYNLCVTKTRTYKRDRSPARQRRRDCFAMYM